MTAVRRDTTCTCRDGAMCPACAAFEPPEPDWLTDADEAALDATVRWYDPDGYRGTSKEYL